MLTGEDSLKKRIFFNWVITVGIVIALLIFSIFGFFFLFPTFNSANWIIWGTFILGTSLALITFSRVSPLILVLNENTITFIGIPWIFRMKRENMEKVVIRNWGFEFIPKHKKDYRWVYTWKEGKYSGYKGISFGSLGGWGALINFFKPNNPQIDIKWKVLSKKAKRYIQNELSAEIGKMERADSPQNP